MKGRIAIAGAIAQKPRYAGHAWQFLQYLLGFRRLGYEVLFLDRIVGDHRRRANGMRWLAEVMRETGLEGCWSLDLGDGRHAGVDRRRARRFMSDADLLLNVMGFLTDEELLGAAPVRIFLDTDPGFPQMWHALGLADVLTGHDIHVTIAERIGEPGCKLPTCGLRWVTMPQPVVLDQWPVCPPGDGSRFTSIASWRGAYAPIEYEGHRYGLRVHELRRFAELPHRAGGEFELALDIDGTDEVDAELLRIGGWKLITPGVAASTLGGYRRYVQRSDAEVMVAKGMYVDSRGGWVSERSLCYLASGRPVLMQDTGVGERHQTGEGLLTFATIDQALAGIEAIRTDPLRHARAARALAEERFDSDRVLGDLLDQVNSARALAA